MAKLSGVVRCVVSVLVGCGEVKGTAPDAGTVVDAAPDIDAAPDAPVDGPEARVTIGGVASYLPSGGPLVSLELLDGMGAVIGMPLMVMTDGPFTFPTDLPATGAAYSVRIASAPTGATCWVEDRGGTGTTAGANITSLVARCVKATTVRATADLRITATTFPADQNNPVLPLVPLTLAAPADVLVTLTVPSTSGIDTSVWDLANAWAGVRDGVAAPALLGVRQQVAFEMGGPLQLTGVLRLAAGTHNLEAVFRSDVAAGVVVNSGTQLTAIVLDSLSTYAGHTGAQAPSLFATLGSLQQVALVDVTLAAAAPALVYAHVPSSEGTGAPQDTWTSGDFTFADGTSPIAIAGHDAGEDSTNVATTMLGGRMMGAGTHRLHLDATCANNGVSTCTLAFGAADLNIGMIQLTPTARLNIAATTATSGYFTTGSTSFTAVDGDGGVNELSTSITLAAPRQVLVMLSTQRVLTTQNGNSSELAVFHNGAALAGWPVFTSPNRDRGVSMPSYTLVSLPAGTHTFDARWRHTNQNNYTVAASIPKAGNALSLLVLE